MSSNAPPHYSTLPPHSVVHPFTHPDMAAPVSKTIFSAISSWLSPANHNTARLSQMALLNCIPQNPAIWSLRTGFVDVSPTKSLPGEEALINTLVIESSTILTANRKPPVLFLHGYGAGMAMWYPALGQIANDLVPRGHSLYAIDWLGMARSSRKPWPKPPSVEDNLRPLGVQQAEDYFIDALDKWCSLVLGPSDQIILVGHSLGGYLASTFALRYPNRVNQLILVSPVGIPTNPVPPSTKMPIHWQAMRKLFHVLWTNSYTPFSLMRGLGPFGPKLMKLYTSRRFAVSIPTKYEQDLVCDYLFHSNNAGKAAGEYALSALLHSGAWAKDPIGPRLSPLWGLIPVRFVYGTVDWMDYMHAVRLLMGQNVEHGHATVHLVDQAGHQVFIDNPSGFIDVLLDSVTSESPSVGCLSKEDMEALPLG